MSPRLFGRIAVRFVQRMALQTKHTERTAENTREPVISPATIIQMREESKTIKGLTLKIHNKNVSFKAGQWLDMMIPGLDVVGGYSMCSSPQMLQDTGELELAVKYSTHPPTLWVHTQCNEGTEVRVRVGGDFLYEADIENPEDLLLIAGGVGINPMYSIINYIADLQDKGENSVRTTHEVAKAKLLYSAQSLDELIFKDKLQALETSHPNIKCQYFVTRDKDAASTQQIHTKRIQKADLADCLSWLRPGKTTVYICGPSPMISSMEDSLLSLGIPKSKILYEKWW